MTKANHKTEVWPIVDEISVCKDRVWFRQVALYNSYNACYIFFSLICSNFDFSRWIIGVKTTKTTMRFRIQSDSHKTYSSAIMEFCQHKSIWRIRRNNPQKKETHFFSSFYSSPFFLFFFWVPRRKRFYNQY